MRYGRFAWGAVFVLAVTTTTARGASSVADGAWDDPNTWEGGGIPDQSLNNGNGDEVFINSNIVVPAGIDFVNTTTIDANGDPVDGNLWMFFSTDAPLGASLTIQNGARVGSRFWSMVSGTGSAQIDIESGGEYVTAGINTGANASLTVNVKPGGLLTFDSSIHPPFPEPGFYRGNIAAAEGATNTFNVEGRLDVVNLSNSNVGDNTYHLINGGVINEVPFPGQAIGAVSSNPRPPGSISYQAITVTGTGNRIVNAFGGAPISHVPSGLTVDVSDQSVLDFSGTGGWADWISSNGGNPTTVSGPRTAEISGTSFSGDGAIQLDIYGFAVNEQVTALEEVFHDQLFNGPGAAANSTFSGSFELGYVGGTISDEVVDLLNSSQPALLLINGATNGSFFDNLDGLPVPEQVWNDGSRQFLVTFSDMFFFDLGPPFPPGMADTRLPFTTLQSISPIVGPGLPGDFDDDGVVDGHDFLLWQRGGSPDPLSSGDLAAWEANFGTPAVAVAVVPEPSAMLLGSVGLLLIGLRRRTN